MTGPSPHVVLASGDRIFAPAVSPSPARRGSLSWALELAAGQRVIYLDAPGHLPVGQDAA